MREDGDRPNVKSSCINLNIKLQYYSYRGKQQVESRFFFPTTFENAAVIPLCIRIEKKEGGGEGEGSRDTMGPVRNKEVGTEKGEDEEGGVPSDLAKDAKGGGGGGEERGGRKTFHFTCLGNQDLETRDIHPSSLLPSPPPLLWKQVFFLALAEKGGEEEGICSPSQHSSLGKILVQAERETEREKEIHGR